MYILIGLIIFVCVLLVLVVLAQNSKGGGLSGQFGGSASQLIGAKQTTDLLEKATWWLASALIVFSLSMSVFVGQPGKKTNSPNFENVEVPADPGTIEESNPSTGADTTK